MSKAIVLLSGGVDSTVVLALALKEKKECLALTFNYGQKHIEEIGAAKKIAAWYGIPHRIITIEPFSFSGSSLTSNTTCPKGRSESEIAVGGIPNTYVPGRNTLFLAYALSFAEMIEAEEIHFGPNAHDHACYPDCSPDYLEQFQQLIRVATKQSVEKKPPALITPCLYWTKKEIVKQGQALKVPFELTWSCYSPTQGLPCNTCDACVIRSGAFLE